MKRLRVPLLLLAAVALWWLAFVSGEPRAKPPIDTTPHVEVPEPIAAPPPEPAAPPPASEPRAIEPKAAPASPGQAAPAAVPAPDSRGFIDVLEQRFEADEPDREARVHESVLLQQLLEIGAATMVRSVACRKTVCKLALRWQAQDDPAYQRLLERLMGDNAKLFATRAEAPDDTGTALIDAYWVRR
jgi:hypothetical protein